MSVEKEKVAPGFMPGRADIIIWPTRGGGTQGVIPAIALEKRVRRALEGRQPSRYMCRIIIAAKSVIDAVTCAPVAIRVGRAFVQFVEGSRSSRLRTGGNFTGRRRQICGDAGRPVTRASGRQRIGECHIHQYPAVIIAVLQMHQIPLFEAALAVDFTRRVARFLQCRQQQPGKNRYNSNHDQQFHQREAFCGFSCKHRHFLSP